MRNDAELWQARVDLATICRWAYRKGFQSGVGNHFSLMVPGTDDEFMAFLSNCEVPLFAPVVAQSEPVSPISTSRSTANRWRHYERQSPPPGFIAIGDAVAKSGFLFDHLVGVAHGTHAREFLHVGSRSHPDSPSYERAP